MQKRTRDSLDVGGRQQLNGGDKGALARSIPTCSKVQPPAVRNSLHNPVANNPDRDNNKSNKNKVNEEEQGAAVVVASTEEKFAISDKGPAEIDDQVEGRKSEKMSKCGRSPERMSSRSSGSPAATEEGLTNNPGNPVKRPQKPYCFDDFELFRTLGTGSYGRVFLVKEKSSGQYYALKRLKKADIVRLKQVEHTNNERKLLGRVPDSPFVVSLVASFQDARYVYLLMEYAAGGELFGLLRRVRTLPSFVAQFYAAELVLVLESLHSKDIIYRDLKPENVLLSDDGHLRLADFGFAKVVPHITWTFCGTPEYLAPELVSATGSGYGRAVDWYALGVLVYEMLFGRPPFYHENHLKLYDLIATQEPKFPESADPVVVDLMKGLLEKNPTRRLGALKGGAEDVKAHSWFKDIAWGHLATRNVRPPYRPKVSGPGDATNFDKYPEDTDPPVAPNEPDDYGRLFPEF